MVFKNRYQVAKLLIEPLRKYTTENAIVLAIPRGGVPIGFHLAKEFHLPLDILLSKKIGHPVHPEMAIGAVGLNGEIVDPWYQREETYVKREIERIRDMLKERYRKFRGNKPPLDIKGKTVIMVDAGIATGYTLLGCIDMLRKQKPKKIIIAVPVAPPETISKIRKKADDLICLSIPENFSAVGQFYEDFSEVSDEEVLRCISNA